MRMLASLLGFAVAAGCGINNEGVPPDRADINFPLAVALSPTDSPADPPQFLFLANSNFDLRFNAGSVQTYRLDAIADEVSGCDDPPCLFEDVQPYLASEVLIGSHTSGMDISPEGDRLYLAIRSEANLTYIDVDPDTGVLSCGGRGNLPRCDAAHQRGDESLASERGVTVPGDPVGIVAASLERLGRPPGGGDYVLMAHRNGQVSLFLDQVEGTGDAPVLAHVVTGLPEGLVNIRLTPDGFAWAPSANMGVVGRVGVAVDDQTSAGDLVRSFAFDLGSLVVQGVDVGGRGDLRDVEFDPRPDVNRAYVLSRRPEAVLVADRDLAGPGDLGVVDVLPTGFGPSRLDVAELDVTTEGGTEPVTKTLLFVSNFDARDIWVIDPDIGSVITIIRGLSGPFELAIDRARNLVYIADFRSSVLRVADLQPLIDCLTVGLGEARESCEPSVVATFGDPRPVGELL